MNMEDHDDIHCTAWDVISDPDFSDLLGMGWQVAYGKHLWEAEPSRTCKTAKLWRLEPTNRGLGVYVRYIAPETPIIVRWAGW